MLSQFRFFLDALLHRRRLERDMDAEMRDHIQRYADDLARSGVPRGEAERRARLEFGSFEAAREECRESRGLRWPDEFWRDLRFGLRMMRKTPVFTATALLTLALCIGANTAVFSVVNAVLLRPLPYPEPDRLAQVVGFGRARGAEFTQRSQTGGVWEVVRDHATFVDAAVMGGRTGVNLAVAGRVEYVQQQRVSAGFFHALSVNPAAGREFTPDEDRIGGPPVTVLSYGSGSVFSTPIPPSSDAPSPSAASRTPSLASCPRDFSRMPPPTSGRPCALPPPAKAPARTTASSPG